MSLSALNTARKKKVYKKWENSMASMVVRFQNIKFYDGSCLGRLISPRGASVPTTVATLRIGPSCVEEFPAKMQCARVQAPLAESDGIVKSKRASPVAENLRAEILASNFLQCRQIFLAWANALT
jgi:hypothetical protein